MCHYIGDTQNGKKQGKGKLLFSDGSYYEGDFKDDLYTGVGTLHLKEYRYVGEFFNGKKQGKGKIEYFVEKKVYEGEFMDDLPSGFGKEIYENGVIYEGFFVNGKKHNKGKLTLANGGEYIGEFKNDSLEGNGYFKWNETKNYKGQWKENCIDGFGVFTDGDKKYIGYFEKDLKNGLGANYYVNNNVYIVSRWKEDKIEDGIAIVFDREGKEDIVKIQNNIIAKKYTEEEVFNNRIKESVSYLDLKRFYDEKILSGFYCNINFE